MSCFWSIVLMDRYSDHPLLSWEFTEHLQLTFLSPCVFELRHKLLQWALHGRWECAYVGWGDRACRCRKLLCWEVRSGWWHLQLARGWYAGLRTHSNIHFSTCFPHNVRAVSEPAKLSWPARYLLNQLTSLLQKAGMAPAQGGSCLWKCRCRNHLEGQGQNIFCKNAKAGFSLTNTDRHNWLINKKGVCIPPCELLMH